MGSLRVKTPFFTIAVAYRDRALINYAFIFVPIGTMSGSPPPPSLLRGGASERLSSRRPAEEKRPRCWSPSL